MALIELPVVSSARASNSQQVPSSQVNRLLRARPWLLVRIVGRSAWATLRPETPPASCVGAQLIAPNQLTDDLYTHPFAASPETFCSIHCLWNREHNNRRKSYHYFTVMR